MPGPAARQIQEVNEVLAVTRYRVPQSDAGDFLARANRAQVVLSQQRGWLGGRVGRATDDPTLWVLTSEWADVGSYRRALGAFDVKMESVPLLAHAIDEPTAFEILGSHERHPADPSDHAARSGPSGRTDLAADAASIGVGEAAAPVVPTDLD